MWDTSIQKIMQCVFKLGGKKVLMTFTAYIEEIDTFFYTVFEWTDEK